MLPEHKVIETNPGTDARDFAKERPSSCSQQSGPSDRWASISSSILKQDYWRHVGNLAKLLNTLPDDISSIYDEIELRSTVKLNHESRLMYYTEFTRIALGATAVHFKDVEALIHRKNPEISISKIDFLTLVFSKLQDSSKVDSSNTENNEYFDFEHFASLIYDLLKYHAEANKSKKSKTTFKDLLCQLPLDPDSGRKQLWDLLCLILLLYCSFSVPFSIAFDEADEQEQVSGKEVFETFMDVMFLTDICLNFITGWDNQGLIVREFSVIAKQYLRTWFLADFAGSFPFDKVISAFVDADQKSLASTNMLRGLRLIRMLKLIRAIKFMNKLEKLKQKEGFEAFGAMISLFSSIFILFFIAHVLGCFYTILLSYEDEGDNWLHHYRPELVDADVTTRYVVALYWAIITIRYAGAPPISRQSQTGLHPAALHINQVD
jgi:hypothetical protein